MNQQIDVSIIILTRNSRKVLPKLLNSLQKQQVNFSFELIFFDNSSRDETEKIIEQISFCPKRVINIPEGEFSHSRTRLKALEYCRAEILVFFTDDIQPQTEYFLQKLVEPVISGKAAAAYGVYQISKEQDALENYLHNDWYLNYEDYSEPISDYCWKILPPLVRRRLINFDNCSSCIKKSILQQYPFPDVPYGEDMLFAKQLILNGQRVALAKEAKFFHWHHVTFKYLLKRMCIDADLSFREIGLKFTASYNQILRAVLKRTIHRTLIILFKLRLNPFKKISLIFYHFKILSADFLGKFIGGLQPEEREHWKFGYTFFYRKKLKIISEINSRSIHRPQKKEQEI